MMSLKVKVNMVTHSRANFKRGTSYIISKHFRPLVANLRGFGSTVARNFVLFVRP